MSPALARVAAPAASVSVLRPLAPAVPVRAFAAIDLPPRSTKPRSSGLTMVLDKNLGLAALDDLLGTAAPAVDLVKFGWGTSATQAADLVRRKCALLAAHQVLACPGGTLGELAWQQGRFGPFLAEARSLGFSCIEVSDGTVDMPHGEKLALIRRALDAGFHVTSEVGSKNTETDRAMGPDERIAQIQAELACGAWKVIIEARESGTHGIFDAQGATRHDLFDQITEHVDADRLIFEAPQRAQQTELLLSLGNRVNLGNIAPADVVGLETLRLGLRSDTMRHFHPRPANPEGTR